MTKLIKRKISETRRKLRKLIYPYLIILLFLTTLTFGIFTAKAAAPSVPSGLTATAVSYSQINLSWSDVSGETRYELQRAPAGGQFSTIAPNISANTTTYQDTGLTPSTTYYYWIRACNGTECSAYSDMTWSDTPAAPPAAPSGLTGTSPSSSQITINWTDNSNNEQGFKVEKASAQEGPFTQVAQTGANIASYSEIGLTSGTTYYYRVRAYNTAGNSAYSNIASATTQTSLPIAPSNLNISGTPAYNQVILFWSDNSLNEQGFKIERSLSQTTGFTQIGTAAANTTSTAMYQDNTVSPSTTYYYRVRAYNTAGNTNYTNTVSATTPAAPPSPPSNMAAVSISHNQINLTFRDNSNNEISFVLERSASESFSSINAVTINSTTTTATGGTISYSDTSLGASDEAKTFYYRVLAKASETVKSAYSNTANATTKLKAPTALTAELITSPLSVNLAWTDNSLKEQNYVVEKSIISATDGFTQLAELPANTNTGTMTYTDTYPDEKKTIYYRVYAKTSSQNSQPTNTVNVTTPERINLQSLSTTPVIGEAKDVALSGNYAYVASSSGLQIVDVSNPQKPLVKSSLSIELCGVVTVDGLGYAYVGADKDVKIINVQDPSNPFIVSSLSIPSYVYNLTFSSNKIYIANDTDGVRVADVLNRYQPSIIGSIDTAGEARNISIKGSIAAVADGTNGVVLINIQNPSQLSVIGQYHTQSDAYDVLLRDNLVYIAANYKLIVIDIANMSSIQKIVEFNTMGTAVGIDLSDDSKIAYISDQSYATTGNGLEIVDLSNLTAPKQLSFTQIIGMSGKRVIFRNNFVYMARRTSGLSIFDSTNPSSPVLKGQERDVAQAIAVKIKGNTLFAMSSSALRSYDITQPEKPVHKGSLNLDSALSFEIDNQGHAFIGGNSVLKVADVSDPSNMYIIPNSQRDLSNNINDVAISGAKLIVANYTSGITILNISNPHSPVITKTVDTPGQAFQLVTSSTEAYIADGDAGMTIVNISTYAIKNTPLPINGSFAYDIVVKDGYAYIAGAGAGLFIASLTTNPPSIIKNIMTEGCASGIIVSENKPYLLVANSSYAIAGNGIGAINIEQPQNAYKVAYAQSDLFAREIASSGRYIFITSDKNLVEIFDLYYDKPKVEKKASVTSQTRGGEITYTLTLTNSSPYDIPLQTLKDKIPIGSRYVPNSADSTGGQYSSTTDTITWSNLGTLRHKQGEEDGKIEVSFKVKIN